MTPTRETFGNLSQGSVVLFYCLTVVTMVVFAWGLWRRFRLWRQGGEGRPLGTYLLTLTLTILAFGLADQGFYYGGPYLLAVAGVAEVALRRGASGA